MRAYMGQYTQPAYTSHTHVCILTRNLLTLLARTYSTLTRSYAPLVKVVNKESYTHTHLQYDYLVMLSYTQTHIKMLCIRTYTLHSK